jgi:hypothetical protein
MKSHPDVLTIQAFKTEFPRLFELYLASQTGSSTNYFEALAPYMSGSDVAASYVPWEQGLNAMDEVAFSALKKKCSGVIHKKSVERNTYQPFIDCINEMYGYLYLQVAGCKDVHFISQVENEPTPDLCGHSELGATVVEVKTVYESAAEFNREHGLLGRGAQYAAIDVEIDVARDVDDPDSAVGRVGEAIEQKRHQLRGYRPPPECGSTHRQVIFIVIQADVRFSLAPINGRAVRAFFAEKENAPRGIEVVVENWFDVRRWRDARS